MRFRAFGVIWGTFFFENFYEREARISKGSKMQAQSEKPEGTKRPSISLAWGGTKELGRVLFASQWSCFYTSTISWWGYIFTAFYLCVCLFVCVCVYVRLCLWTKFQPSGWADLDAVFAKWLFNALAQTLSKLVTLGRRSRVRVVFKQLLLFAACSTEIALFI